MSSSYNRLSSRIRCRVQRLCVKIPIGGEHQLIVIITLHPLKPCLLRGTPPRRVIEQLQCRFCRPLGIGNENDGSRGAECTIFLGTAFYKLSTGTYVRGKAWHAA